MWQDYLLTFCTKRNLLSLEVPTDLISISVFVFFWKRLLLIIHFSPASSYFIPLRSKYSPQHPVPHWRGKNEGFTFLVRESASTLPCRHIHPSVCWGRDSRTVNEHTSPLWQTDNPVTLLTGMVLQGNFCVIDSNCILQQHRNNCLFMRQPK
jgi:hypothetical protein